MPGIITPGADYVQWQNILGAGQAMAYNVPMTRILGIDPGLVHTGWAVIDSVGNNRIYRQWRYFAAAHGNIGVAIGGGVSRGVGRMRTVFAGRMQHRSYFCE